MRKILLLLSVFIPLSLQADNINTVSNVHANPDVENQVVGDYPNLQRKESLPLGAIQHAWDEAPENAGVYRIHFDPNQVIKLSLREFMTTTVVFPLWEVITDVEVGDKPNFEVTKLKPNIVTIKPNGYVGLDSSITLVSESGLVYPFYVRSEGYNSKNISDLKVEILVPAPHFKEKRGVFSPKEPTLQEKQDYLEEVAFDPDNFNFNYSMSGDQSIAPQRIYSDGVRTWFDYGKDIHKKTLPTIYAVIDNVDTPINVNREGNKLVAQYAGSFTLKSGAKFTCVYPTGS